MDDRKCCQWRWGGEDKLRSFPSGWSALSVARINHWNAEFVDNVADRACPEVVYICIM
jgi:hypothetical protein